MENSKKYKLNTADVNKILTGAYIAVGGAVLTYFAELIPLIDFGVYTPLAVSASSVFINTLRKILSGE
jgi:hypothetical protein